MLNKTTSTAFLPDHIGRLRPNRKDKGGTPNRSTYRKVKIFTCITSYRGVGVLPHVPSYPTLLYQCMRRAICASSVASVSPLGGDARSQSSPHGPDQGGQKRLEDGAPDVVEGLPCKHPHGVPLHVGTPVFDRRDGKAGTCSRPKTGLGPLSLVQPQMLSAPGQASNTMPRLQNRTSSRPPGLYPMLP